MNKSYDHTIYEKDIYQKWEASGAFKPEVNPQGKPYTIIMPPPNANDNLHIGHARFVTIEDILIRYHRMKGEAALWLPGADHAGIETQFVFEKRLKEQGKSRFDFDPETLYKMIWEYVQMNKGNMEDQLRSLGASCDWSRNMFTLDPAIIKVVYKTFKKLDDDKLLYRGNRLVNYCTRCGTAYSELEVDHTEKEAEFFTLDYKTIRIATTRPETIFADSAIAVNPKDSKYASLIGKKATIPLTNREIPIIADDAVEIGMGTDALKVTPCHDFTDWEIGKRHKLEEIQIIGTDGKMLSPTPDKYVGMYVNAARKAVVEDLIIDGKLVETTKKQSISSICYRCKNPIEPLPCLQWFIKVKTLAGKAKEAVEKGNTKFATKRFEKIYNHWLDNLKDWNISRQIVWGIQIPAWKCQTCEEWTTTEGETPLKCDHCGENKGSQLVRDGDTFDTWFSSGQWPFATLQSTGQDDFTKFYPTSVMETAYDILPFWVMRMMMLGIYATGKVPFKDVLIHGLIRDKNGQKISKSKGNVINPLEMTDKYGTDALRNSMVWGSLIENDVALSEENIKGQKNFANKIWNMGRFIQMMIAESKSKIEISDNQLKESSIQNSEDRKIVMDLQETITEVSNLMDTYRISEAIEALYDFTWHTMADNYLEGSKQRKDNPETLQVLKYVYFSCLKMLHPFMPFVTEAIWKELGDLRENSEEMLITSKWPENKQ